MKVKSESEVAQSCLTLSDPMDCSPLGSPVHGISQARVLEWGAIAFSTLNLGCSQLNILNSICKIPFSKEVTLTGFRGRMGTSLLECPEEPIQTPILLISESKGEIKLT